MNPDRHDMDNTKDQVINNLITARRNIFELAQGLSPAKQDQVFLGVWSVRDLLAHLIGWDYTNREAVQEIMRGARPTALSHWNPDWQAYNAKLVKEYRREDFGEMLSLLQESHRALISLLQSLDAGDFEHDWGVRSRGGESMTIAWWLQGEIDDEHTHYEQMQTWLAKNKTG